MVKQKICVLGAGLSGLLTAYTLSQKNFEIDIYDPNFFKSKSTNRTTGISNDNFIFLKKFKVFLDNNSIFWPIKEIKIYEGINIESSVETLKFRKKNKNIFFIVNNDIFKEKILKKILNSKNIKIKKKI